MRLSNSQIYNRSWRAVLAEERLQIQKNIMMRNIFHRKLW